ncbi:hypothetical protein J6590_017740 [Homalodisca vitripennis]|nr:hypothetical protein J6590_017740 [Homalodisca vitripennis]
MVANGWRCVEVEAAGGGRPHKEVRGVTVRGHDVAKVGPDCWPPVIAARHGLYDSLVAPGERFHCCDTVVFSKE